MKRLEIPKLNEQHEPYIPTKFIDIRGHRV